MFGKLNNKKTVYLIGLFAIIFAVTLFLIVDKLQKYPDVQKEEDNYTLDGAQLRKFTDRLKTEDPKAVYNEIVATTTKLTFQTRHDIAHIFGKALYQVKKGEGISVCDTNLSFGCYHGLFIEAIKDQGIGVVTTLDKYCEQGGKRLYTGCQHGIGHGLVEYYGRKRIPEALQQCKKIQKNLLVGCSSGVFMEYFFPNSFNDDTTQTLTIDNNNPFEPCKTLNLFINSCIYELPRLWKKTGANINNFKNKCLGLGNPIHQRSCFRGLGYATVSATRPDPDFSLSVCQQIPDQQKKMYCLSGATWGYDTIDETEVVVNAIKTLCTYSNNEKACRSLSNLTSDQI